MLECLYLSDRFGNIAPYRRGQYLESLDVPIWIYNEPSSSLYTAVFIIYTVHFPNAAILVGQHREWYILIHHFREFIVIPHFMNIYTIDADRQYFDTESQQFRVFFSN